MRWDEDHLTVENLEMIEILGPLPRLPGEPPDPKELPHEEMWAIRQRAIKLVDVVCRFMGNAAKKKEDQNKIYQQGQTLKDAAKMLNIDRRKLSKSLVEIPTGPAPALPPGKIPARRFGNTVRIFFEDIFGLTDRNNTSGGDHAYNQKTASDPSNWTKYHRQIADLRDRGIDGE